jgi:membrane-bound lytic murein transglycosylase D
MRAANQRPIVALGVLLALWALSGCSTSRRPPGGDTLATVPPSAGDPGFPAVSTAQPAGHPGDVPELDVEHPRVQTLMVGYQTTMRPTLERALQRGSKYLPSMKNTLKEEGVPPEFAYGVPIVESGYSLQATSHAGAVGPWQFIRGTGKRYGLRIDGYVDERRDPEKATRAAARYLRDLYDRFGDWHLALAAYNTGEGNIERIRDNRGCEDFWEMRDRGFLPSETSEYVPKVLAAMEVAKSAKEYGIEVVKSPPARFDTIQITRPISLKAVAQLTGSDVDTIRELNPALKRGVVPPDGYEVRLPEGTRDQFTVALASYREPEPEPMRFATSSRGSYKVRRGDTLGRIASRYGVSVSALARANGLRVSRGVRAGQQLRIPGRTGTVRLAARATRAQKAQKATKPSSVSRSRRAPQRTAQVKRSAPAGSRRDTTARRAPAASKSKSRSNAAASRSRGGKVANAAPAQARKRPN